MSYCKKQIERTALVFEFKNQTPRVFRNVCGTSGSTLDSFTDKTNSCLHINIMTWSEKLVVWELSIHEFSIREIKLGFPWEIEVQSKGRGKFGKICWRERGRDADKRMSGLRRFSNSLTKACSYSGWFAKRGKWRIWENRAWNRRFQQGVKMLACSRCVVVLGRRCPLL